MRLVVFLLGLSLLGGAAYFHYGPHNSFSSYSDGQLTTLAAALSTAGHSIEEVGADARVSATLLEDELNRRQRRTMLLGAGAALLAISLVLPRRTRKEDPAEAARLQAFLGSAPATDTGARARAAQLLGVAPDAPDSVIEAAYEAQCRQRDRARYDGIKPDLVRLAEHQLSELAWARDQLLGRRGTTSSAS